MGGAPSRQMEEGSGRGGRATLSPLDGTRETGEMHISPSPFSHSPFEWKGEMRDGRGPHPPPSYNLLLSIHAHLMHVTIWPSGYGVGLLSRWAMPAWARIPQVSTC